MATIELQPLQLLEAWALASGIWLVLGCVLLALPEPVHPRLRSWAGPLALVGSAALSAGWLPGPELRLAVFSGLVLLAAASALCAPVWHVRAHAVLGSVLAAAIGLVAINAALLVRGLEAWWILAAVLTAQVATLGLAAISTAELLGATCRRRWREAADEGWLEPAQRPFVSLHLPIHAEPPAVVLETLRALAALDYADYEVIVVDNNTHDEALWRPIERACAQLGPQFRFFHLDPWPGYKAGALNFALDRTAPEAEIVGVVDADYVVDPSYLRDLVGAFEDPKLAFVQTPQDYRDLECRGRFARAMYYAYLFFFRVTMPVRNEHNAIIFAGTMGLLRRSVLEQVGGWAEWCITEDAELSLRILNRGYRSVFVAKSYGRGLMPLDYAGLRKQRARWARGGMQILRRYVGALLFPGREDRLTLAQRGLYLVGLLQWLSDLLGYLLGCSLAAAAIGWALLGAGLPGASFAAALVCAGLLILSALFRFVWALRRTTRCSWGTAVDSLVLLLGLAGVTAWACVRGLCWDEHHFLRTPKLATGGPRLAGLLHLVRWEATLGIVFGGAAAAVIVEAPRFGVALSTGLAALLLWSLGLVLATLWSARWSFAETRLASGDSSTESVPIEGSSEAPVQ
jgi:cellulose synthase/poly-beta-1,6-N-acetylglucosamine synthase-like glycosyltransferase